MPDKLTLDERGALIVVQVDDEGNRIDAPAEAKPEPVKAPVLRIKHRRNKRG